jgi:L-histidine Nalpha-methyltransferase
LYNQRSETLNNKYEKLLQVDYETESARFAKDVFLGLMRTRKMIPSKYLYDDIGSEIYEEIMNIPEYYLVSSEYNCLNLAKEDLCKILSDSKVNLIELGSGNGYKTKILLKQFVKDNLDFTYIPVDISEGAMNSLIKDINEEFPTVSVRGYVADYFDALAHLYQTQENSRKNLVLFLGSSIGNFTFEEATDFIFSLWRTLKTGDMVLMGFDIRKDISTMLPAYNDSNGITQKFNLNLLNRMNRELDANFDVSKWEHYEPYDVYEGSMKSYIIATEEQDVYIKRFNKKFHFKKWEPIYIEQSYKYTVEDIENLASITGFKVDSMYFDEKKYFANSLWTVYKKPIQE